MARAAGIAPPLEDERRLTLLRRLLQDEALDPRDRFAGALVLLFGQPLTRIARLRRGELSVEGDTVALRLGRAPLVLPEPLASLAIALRERPGGLARAAASEVDWLFPGRTHGSLPERFGLHHARASEWVRAAGAPYADYVALLTHGAGAAR